jgi:hypothetical protein
LLHTRDQLPPFPHHDLFQRWNISHLTFEKDTEPYARKRDAAILELAQKVGKRAEAACVKVDSSACTHLRKVCYPLYWVSSQKKIAVTAFATHTLFDPEDYLKKCGGADKVVSLPATLIFYISTESTLADVSSRHQVPVSYGSFQTLFARMGRLGDPVDAPGQLPASSNEDLVGDGALLVFSPLRPTPPTEFLDPSLPFELRQKNKDFDVPKLEELGYEPIRPPLQVLDVSPV